MINLQIKRSNIIIALSPIISFLLNSFTESKSNRKIGQVTLKGTVSDG